MPISEHFIIGTIASDYALALVCTAADTDLTMAEHYSRVKLVKNALSSNSNVNMLTQVCMQRIY